MKIKFEKFHQIQGEHGLDIENVVINDVFALWQSAIRAWHSLGDTSTPSRPFQPQAVSLNSDGLEIEGNERLSMVNIVATIGDEIDPRRFLTIELGDDYGSVFALELDEHELRFMTLEAMS